MVSFHLFNLFDFCDNSINNSDASKLENNRGAIIVKVKEDKYIDEFHLNC
jgi:hypothetical protein